ncbi:MAG: cell envelope integrity protein TolA [Sulfuricaulis sp.]
MLPNKFRRNPGRFRAIIYAVLVHAVVIGLLVIGFRWSVQPSSDQNVVQAVAVPEPAPRQTPAVDQHAQQEQEARKKLEAEKSQQAELLKKQEVEREQEQEQEQAKAKVKAKVQAQALKREAAERKQKQAEQQEQQEQAAAQARQQEEMRQQKHAIQSLQAQLAAEEKQRADSAHAAQVASEVDKYTALIKQQVNRSWNRPVGEPQGLKCLVHVSLTPSGEVLSVTVVRSSGDAAFDRSVEYAVYKAAPLPLPEDPSLFDNFREIEFWFNPEK